MALENFQGNETLKRKVTAGAFLDLCCTRDSIQRLGVGMGGGGDVYNQSKGADGEITMRRP